MRCAGQALEAVHDMPQEGQEEVIPVSRIHGLVSPWLT